MVLCAAGFVAARADPSVSDTSNELRAVTVIPDVSRGTPSAREVPLPRGVTELAGGFHGMNDTRSLMTKAIPFQCCVAL